MSIFERLYDSLFRPAPDASELGQGRYKENEAAPYTVVRRMGDVEIRRYPPTLHAEVVTRGTQDDALSEGFGTLAGYIFGGNRDGRKVAMTVPVEQAAPHRGRVGVTGGPDGSGHSGGGDINGARGGEGTWTVSFMMPAEYTRETLPVPEGSEITFVDVPGGLQAVKVLEGRATTEALDAATAALRDTLAAEGIAPSGPVRYWFYDDPLTPFWKRRNEVAFALDTNAG